MNILSFPRSCRSVSSNALFLFCVLSVAVLSAVQVCPIQAQNRSEELKVRPTSEDRAAAQEAKLIYQHARPANTSAGAALRHKDIVQANASTTTSMTTTVDNDRLSFPTDLSFLGGPTVFAAESHAIYLLPNGKCQPVSSCWGNPEGFLADLGVSDFIHVLDQYVHFGANNRYTVGNRATSHYTPTPNTAPLTDADMLAVVHGFAAATGQIGYGHIFHVFLPPGQDECLFPGVCYSPDVQATFAFCGYHSSATFKDIGHVLYTVEPFQDVAGCSVKPGTPNGQLADSTYNTLSHETFETITDPDGDAWFNFSAVVLAFAEIGDECSFFVIQPVSPKSAEVFFNPSVFTIGTHRYAVQPEYANDEHACTTNL